MAGQPGRSGGVRDGAPGRAYKNRSDLQQGVRTAPGQQYGAASAQRAAQKVIPLPNQSGVPTVLPQTPQTQAVPLSAPTQNPGEPVSAGMPFGPGPGPEILPPTADPTDPVAKLQAVYAVAPNPDLADLIAHLNQ